MSISSRSRFTRGGLAVAAVTALAVPATVLVTAAPASANAPCGTRGVYRDGRIVDQTRGVSANMRSGSSTGCGVVGWADNQDTLLYYCYTRSSSGARWTYVFNGSDITEGWVSSSLLPGNGSQVPCGF